MTSKRAEVNETGPSGGPPYSWTGNPDSPNTNCTANDGTLVSKALCAKSGDGKDMASCLKIYSDSDEELKKYNMTEDPKARFVCSELAKQGLLTADSNFHNCLNSKRKLEPTVTIKAAINSCKGFNYDANFGQCLEIYQQNYTQADATSSCVDIIKQRQFKFDSVFRHCYEIYKQSYTAADSADECVGAIHDKGFKFDANFDHCYELYKQSYTAADSADECEKIIETKGFNFDAKFDACYKSKRSKLTSADSVDECIKK